MQAEFSKDTVSLGERKKRQKRGKMRISQKKEEK